MYKKLLIGLAVLFVIIFSFHTSFANNGMDEAANGAREMVNGTGNAIKDAGNATGTAIEDAANSVTNATRDASNAIENKATEMKDDAMNTVNNAANNIREGAESTMNSTYDATRTAITPEETGNTFMGMSTNAWTWLIVGVAAIAIVALIWYYTMQVRSTNHFDDED